MSLSPSEPQQPQNHRHSLTRSASGLSEPLISCCPVPVNHTAVCVCVSVTWDLSRVDGRGGFRRSNRLSSSSLRQGNLKPCGRSHRRHIGTNKKTCVRASRLIPDQISEWQRRQLLVGYVSVWSKLHSSSHTFLHLKGFILFHFVTCEIEHLWSLIIKDCYFTLQS